MFRKGCRAAHLRTASERVLTRSASERLEIIPAQYERVDTKVLAKEAGGPCGLEKRTGPG